MKIKFIGTGSGVTSLKRFHSSILISATGYKLLIDAGDGISRALLSSKIPYNKIDGIIISHLHPDHYSGIASLIVQMKAAGRKNNLDIFIHRSLEENIENFLRQSYIFYERLNFKIKYRAYEHWERNRAAEGFYFTSKQNTHLEHYRGFDKGNTLSYSSSSFLFEYKNRNILYTGDIGSKEDIYLFKGEKMSIIISEITHLKIAELLPILKELKADKIFLTHISDGEEAKLKKFYKTLSKEEAERITAAYDGMTVDI